MFVQLYNLATNSQVGAYVGHHKCQWEKGVQNRDVLR